MANTSVLTSMHSNNLGQPIPNTPHAVSVSLPTWKAVVGYEEGEEWVLSKMKTGYPRFFIHSSITALGEMAVKDHGFAKGKAILFPSNAVAMRCVEFLNAQVPTLVRGKDLRVVDFYPCLRLRIGTRSRGKKSVAPLISAVIFPGIHSKVAKTFWQHTGDGISSRRAEFCRKAYEDGLLSTENCIADYVESNMDDSVVLSKGPRRYQKSLLHSSRLKPQSPEKEVSEGQISKTLEEKEHVQFVEERFGRNLDMSLAANAKLAIRRRIAGALTANVDLEEALGMTEDTLPTRQVQDFSEHDVYLYPSGMSSIFNTHRTLMECRGELKSVCFGFPYIDTLKILEKWGPGCLFYGDGSASDIEDLAIRCRRGERYLAVFCEFPGNPLLKSPDLCRLRSLADRYDFAIVVDETIGNFLNVHVLPFADVVVSSLTKVFSGDSNVMGGSAVLNPKGLYYQQIRKAMIEEYEDNYWAEDAIYMERNSRDFVSRIERINRNAEAICDALRASPIVKEVYYPKYSPTRPFYEHCRNRNGGYGGLLSVTFHSTAEAVIFFVALETAKGPSLGTNFTISSPYVLLAHYGELEWCAQFGVEVDLVRISVGLEDSAHLTLVCERALAACRKIRTELS